MRDHRFLTRAEKSRKQHTPCTVSFVSTLIDMDTAVPDIAQLKAHSCPVHMRILWLPHALGPDTASEHARFPKAATLG